MLLFPDVSPCPFSLPREWHLHTQIIACISFFEVRTNNQITCHCALGFSIRLTQIHTAVWNHCYPVLTTFQIKQSVGDIMQHLGDVIGDTLSDS